MKKTKILLGLLCLLLSTNFLIAQSITQTIRGTIVDQDSKMPLIGINVVLLNTDPLLGASTDPDGHFKIENVPVGRHNIEFNYLGYEPLALNSILLTAGKELVLELGMVESAITMDEVVVSAKNNSDKTKPLNEFATLSSRTFSVEETSRYAAAAFDPARMAQNYAGVSIGAGADLFNEIIIRGNSPGGVLWRLEGIEIPNPNHFGQLGNSGGAISMLSSSTLSNSDFYTGAFPAEFGNATAGVFDLNMRNGNNQKREFAFMFGALGVEAAAEGPFSKNSKASYLVNYRYSTLALIQAIGINPTGDILPTYQDLSFKLNFPTKNAGTFALFGLGGNNLAAFTPEQDSSKWERPDDRQGFEEPGDVGTVGISHRLLLSGNSYLRTVAIGSFERFSERGYFLNNNYDEFETFRDETKQTTLRLSTLYHHKLNAQHSFRMGAIISAKKFTYFSEERAATASNFTRFFDNEGRTTFLQTFAQWKYRINNKLTWNSGLHYSLLGLNNKMAIEPRSALSWKINNKQSISASVGLHSKMESLALYTFEGSLNDGEILITAKDHLGLTKSLHTVLGYDHVFNPKLRIKAEVYYQQLYEVPVQNTAGSKYSILNAFDIWDVIGIDEAVAEGKGRNIGLDLTIEKFFTDQYYYMITGSLYDSKFTGKEDKYYNTRFNGNYQLNVLGGKEFKMGKKKSNILGFNGKVVLSGGARYTPVDLEASQLSGETVYFEDQIYSEKTGDYFRLDLGMSYRINKKRMTHTILFDIQNITNRQNIFEYYYDDELNSLVGDTQTGLFPFFNYRVEF